MIARRPTTSGFVVRPDEPGSIKGHVVRRGRSHTVVTMISQGGNLVCPQCGASFVPAFDELTTTGECRGSSMTERFNN
jgi:hypothetical protein